MALQWLPPKMQTLPSHTAIPITIALFPTYVWLRSCVVVCCCKCFSILCTSIRRTRSDVVTHPCDSWQSRPALYRFKFFPLTLDLTKRRCFWVMSTEAEWSIYLLRIRGWKPQKWLPVPHGLVKTNVWKLCSDLDWIQTAFNENVVWVVWPFICVCVLNQHYSPYEARPSFTMCTEHHKIYNHGKQLGASA